MSTAEQKRIAKLRNEVEGSLTNARISRDQWLAATTKNPGDLSKNEIYHICKTFKNRLLTLKWDNEDLEELISVGDNDPTDSSEIAELKKFIHETREEVTKFMAQIEEFESNRRIFNKHGITLPNVQTSIIQNPVSQYVIDSDADYQIHLDKRQLETGATIFNNALYDYYENGDRSTKSLSAKKVFNNLTRPNRDVSMDTNENEMILEMLETEYYNPPIGLGEKSSHNNALRKLYDAGITRRGALGTAIFMLVLIYIVIL